jgi:hypothetical protein
MTWVRRRLRFGSWLALVALAIQLALSFGHIHAEDFATTADNQTSISVDHAGGGFSDSDHHGLGHRDCDNCATIALLATLVISSPPALTVLATHSVVSQVVVETGRQYPQQVDHSRPERRRSPDLPANLNLRALSLCTEATRRF